MAIIGSQGGIEKGSDVPDTVRKSATFDLEGVETEQRAERWCQAAGSLFPGLRARAPRTEMPVGSISGRAFGPGQLWQILSPPVSVDCEPAPGDPFADALSVMLQLQGSTVATQGQHMCVLTPGDICLIDGSVDFHLDVAADFSQIMFLRMPRYLILSRYPYLESRTAQKFEPDEPGTSVLRSVLTGLLESASLLEPDQCTTALVGAACLLGVPKPPHSDTNLELNWRVRAALAYIDAELPDPALNATRVATAQGISRRRLDEILLQTVGLSLNAQIWNRRLAQAATDLRDPRHSTRTVTDIAFAVGFVDAAHFARSFKRRYLCSPRDWRSRN
jgi:AraC family transcriptional activator of tynA and feaB